MAESQPGITVGLPVANGEAYLEHTLRALLAQTRSDFEVVVSDNASTDRTADIVRDYVAKDKRIRFFRVPENRGAAWNYNITVECARGRYFRWAAHDDLCAPTHLERCAAILDTRPEVVLVYPKTMRIDSEGHPLGEYDDDVDLHQPEPELRFIRFMTRRWRECNAVFGLMRTDVLRRTRLIGAYPSSDDVLLAEITLHGCIVQVPELLFLRRDHPGTSLRANRTTADVNTWFDTRRKGVTGLPLWRRFAGYGGGIIRAPISVRQKAHCFRFLVGQLYERRYGLRHELMDALVRTCSWRQKV